MKTSVIGFPRVGEDRELKFATEKYFKDKISADEIEETAKEIRQKNWEIQKEGRLDFISSNDFSFYDQLLDTANLVNIIPNRYQALDLSDLDKYFAQARGYQGEAGDVKALAMKKWFNTNYHYMVPEIEDQTEIKLVGDKPFREYQEAKDLSIETKPVIQGPFTLLHLSDFVESKTAADVKADLIAAYIDILNRFEELGAEWVQFDEPALVTDLTAEEIDLFKDIYQEVLAGKGGVKVLLQTYFGDIRDAYQEIVGLDFDGIGLDFVEGKQSLDLVQSHGFPSDKLLFAGVINGKNIWANNYDHSLELLEALPVHSDQLVINTSCSLLHVPFTTANESALSNDYLDFLAFAVEKVDELNDLKAIVNEDKVDLLKANKDLFARQRFTPNKEVQEAVSELTEDDFKRQPSREDRVGIQKDKFNLPLLPTTTIGSFPQTREVRRNRSQYKKGQKTYEEYVDFNKEEIKKTVALQEELGLDVLVHGEFERNDMVEFFGEKLAGYIFTEKAWVQSYGTRCVKPPIIWGDVSRKETITAQWSQYAQSLTDLPMKGMLTGPVTMYNWSFPREDISMEESVYQLALAIQDEVLDLEEHDITIIQIDEAALREKLPLRQSDWRTEYLDFAIPAFRLVAAKVKPSTQIHTHMCYSEFEDIIEEIDAMDADVISFEASRSDLSILDVLQETQFETQVGPGVYDIHSPRVPSKDELKETIQAILDKIPVEKVWVNPDCGLKTRGIEEVQPALENMVQATKEIRERL